MDLQSDIVLSAVNLELLRISQVWNSGVFAEDLQADNLFSAVNLAPFRITQILGDSQVSQRIYKPTPFPTAVHLELFQISQGWNIGAFSEDLPSRQRSFNRGFGAF